MRLNGDEVSFGDAIAIVGLVLAIFQMRRAERAAVAARLAVESASTQVGLYSLLLLIPELALVEKELDRVATSMIVNETQRLLQEWQARASELRGLLGAEFIEIEGLSAKVQGSIALATQARGQIAKGRPTDTATTRVRDAASEVVLVARSEGARIRAQIPPPIQVPTLLDELMTYLRQRFGANND